MIGKPEEKEKYLPTCVFSMVANRHPVGDNSLTDNKKRFQNALFFLLVSTSPSFSVICLLQVEKWNLLLDACFTKYTLIPEKLYSHSIT